MDTKTPIPGYTHGIPTVGRSPVTLSDFERMKATVLFGEEDVECLRISRGILEDQVDAILDVWYGFVASQPHLAASFGGRDGVPSPEYLKAVRKRFGQWIMDTARAEYDQAWLDYQHEIGLRHHRTKKNRTDGVQSSDIVPFRDLFGLVFPVTLTLKPFLANRGHGSDVLEKMHAAWIKICLLQVTLWCHPYVKEGDF